MIQIDWTHMLPFISPDTLPIDTLATAHQQLQTATGKGGDFTGWVRLPQNYPSAELSAIRRTAQKIQQNSRALIVIGAGGSYLGARGAIELLCSPYYNLKKKDTPNIYFAGHDLSASSLTELLELIGEEDFSVNVISKSGSTTETGVAFRFFREILEKKYNAQEAASRIYVTTSSHQSSLLTLAQQEGYQTFSIPEGVGGRYSILTAVGLLPMAVAGIDVMALLEGAQEMMGTCRLASCENPAWQYAGARHALYESGKKIEILATFEPAFRYMAKWWEQLYGESEGKENKGIFPSSAEFTSDLHSMGQYIQQGERLLFETILCMEMPPSSQAVPYDHQNQDSLNYLAGKTLDYINKQVMYGTLLAHKEGGVPVLMIRAGHNTPYDLGQMVYFFEYACGLSAYLLQVNPFDQPGVEAYKKNVFALLGKPGSEARRKQLLSHSLRLG